MAMKFDFGDVLNGASRKVAEKSHEVVMVPIEEIDANEANDIYQIGDISVLASSIEAEGLHAPVLVTRARNGRWRLVAGHRRVEAFKRLSLKNPEETKWNSIPAIIKTYDNDLREKLDLVLDNASGREMTDYERLLQYKRLKEILAAMKKESGKAGKVRDMVASALEMSSGQAARYEAVLNCVTTEGMEKLRQGDTTITKIYELSKKPRSSREKKRTNSSETVGKESQSGKGQENWKRVLQNWQQWPVWVIVPELGMTVLHYILPDDWKIVATIFDGERPEKTPHFLVLAPGESYSQKEKSTDAVIKELSIFEGRKNGQDRT